MVWTRFKHEQRKTHKGGSEHEKTKALKRKTVFKMETTGYVEGRKEEHGGGD
jgi:hypothetical protein